MKKRIQFYSESVYAIKPSHIPSKGTKTWSIQDIIGEVIRLRENCPHVHAPQQPKCEFGISIDRLREYEAALITLAQRQKEDYVRFGGEFKRSQKLTTPILLAAVASYPEPDMLDTEARRRWVSLVIDAAKARWGKRFRSAISHADEGFFHMHLFVDNVGASVKALHYGHKAASDEPQKSLRGVAYRQGCAAVQDWYFDNVGSAMGWLRASPTPVRRTSRPEALSRRQVELEEKEARLAEEAQRLDQLKRELDAFWDDGRSRSNSIQADAAAAAAVDYTWL